MTMHGSPLTASDRAHWNSLSNSAYLTMLIVGILSAVAVTMVRIPLHLPGHTALLWLTPIVASRLVTRARWGATVSSCSCGITMFLLGGHLAGGLVMTPVIALAGYALDLVAGVLQHIQSGKVSTIMVLAIAASMVNMSCMAMRLIWPGGFQPSIGDSANLWIFIGSHGLFGIIAGLLGAGIVLLRKQ